MPPRPRVHRLRPLRRHRRRRHRLEPTKHPKAGMHATNPKPRRHHHGPRWSRRRSPPRPRPPRPTSRPMSVMRKKIAEHMIMSRRTSAHVHSVFEVNFSGVAKVRDARRAEFEKSGAKLTYMSFIIKAAADALRAVPIVNASIDGDNIV